MTSDFLFPGNLVKQCLLITLNYTLKEGEFLGGKIGRNHWHPLSVFWWLFSKTLHLAFPFLSQSR